MKKLAGVIAAVAISSSAYAVDPTASVVWNGMVPGSTGGDTIMITGLAGGAIGGGTLVVANGGSFTSSTIILEAHETTDGVTPGDITVANWTLSSALLNYTTTATTGLNLEVQNDGTLWNIGEVLGAGAVDTGIDTLRLTVSQDADAGTTSGELVQVQVTVVAAQNV
ncbi:hypothetical protein KFE26_02240 [Shewanella sp. M16]|uniref:hypothetical protein n=1 Tax=Shewanella sp. M16 TaxID=2830837 RepID=UPI001BB004CD|nr:hypothetical protein [Shewanella sp. M16]MBS0041131.1 hypothetical protein [Shewanella sp. M16]